MVTYIRRLRQLGILFLSCLLLLTAALLYVVPTVSAADSARWQSATTIQFSADYISNSPVIFERTTGGSNTHLNPKSSPEYQWESGWGLWRKTNTCTIPMHIAVSATDKGSGHAVVTTGSMMSAPDSNLCNSADFQNDLKNNHGFSQGNNELRKSISISNPQVAGDGSEIPENAYQKRVKVSLSSQGYDQSELPINDSVKLERSQNGQYSQVERKNGSVGSTIIFEDVQPGNYRACSNTFNTCRTFEKEKYKSKDVTLQQRNFDQVINIVVEIDKGTTPPPPSVDTGVGLGTVTEHTQFIDPITVTLENAGTGEQVKSIQTERGQWSGHTATYEGAFGGIAPGEYRVCVPSIETVSCQTVRKTSSNSPTVTLTGEQQDGNLNERASCEDSSPMAWGICPLVEALDSALNWVDTQIQRLLEIDKDYYDNPEIKSAWATIRNTAYIILIPMMLAMVIGTALGFDFVSAYTVKKSLPRFFIAVIFIALSYHIGVFLIEFFNVIGRGILGFLTAPFDQLDGSLTLSKLFAPGNVGTGAFSGLLSLAALGIGVAVIVWLFAGTLLLFAGTAFLVLLVRQIFIVALLLVAPLAILAWIFPANVRLWKMWWGSFSKLLMMFPIIMALLAVGRIFAVIIWAGDGGSLQGAVIQPLMTMAAWMIPYAFIPFTFKMAGGVFATVTGVINDKEKGLFDRQKKARQQKIHNFKTGSGEGPISRSRFINRVGTGMGVGRKGLYGFGQRGREARSRLAGISSGETAKNNPMLQQLALESDEGIAVQALSGGTALGAKQAVADLKQGWIKAGTSEAKAEEKAQRAMAAAQAVGFSRTNSQAAFNLMAQNKSRAIGAGEFGIVASGINRLAAGNPEQADAIKNTYQYYSRGAGRFDLGKDTPAQGLAQASLYELANANPNSIKGAAAQYQAILDDDNASVDSKIEAAVFFKDIEAAMPSAKGEVRNTIRAAVNDNKVRVDSFINHPDHPRIEVPRVAEVTRTDPTTGNQITQQEQVGVEQISEVRNKVERLTRQYQRPDPNNLVDEEQ